MLTDVNRQAWTSSSSVLVHPSELYVGLKRATYFVEKGKPIKLDTIVVDHDGKAVEGRDVIVKAELLDWSYKAGVWEEKLINPQRNCNGITDCLFIQWNFAKFA